MELYAWWSRADQGPGETTACATGRRRCISSWPSSSSSLTGPPAGSRLERGRRRCRVEARTGPCAPRSRIREWRQLGGGREDRARSGRWPCSRRAKKRIGGNGWVFPQNTEGQGEHAVGLAGLQLAPSWPVTFLRAFSPSAFTLGFPLNSNLTAHAPPPRIQGPAPPLPPSSASSHHPPALHLFGASRLP